jgi:hypothetical protein
VPIKSFSGIPSLCTKNQNTYHLEANTGKFTAYRKEIEEFGIKDPVELLINNREVIAVKNQKELRGIGGYSKTIGLLVN